MKKQLILFLITMIFAPGCFAQTQPVNFVFQTTDQNIDLEQHASFHFQYLLDLFTPGTIFFENGNTEKAEMNYNVLLDEIQYFHNNQRQSLMPDKPGIDHVKIGDHKLVAYEEEGFFEVFETSKGPVLLKRKINTNSEIIVRGAYGQVVRTSTPRQVDGETFIRYEGAVYRGYGLHNPEKNEVEVTMRYEEVFYFPRNDNDLVKLSARREVSRAFPDKSKKINNFIRKNSIDFKSLESIKTLAEFLYSL
jgi:hypothetical protein